MSEFCMECSQEPEHTDSSVPFTVETANRIKKSFEEKKNKAFFITTLGIGRKIVETAFGKKNRKNISPIKDKRGKHQPHNKTPTQDRDIVRQHIESFPTMESHYTRKDSNKQYLSCDLSIRKMVDLYSIERKEKHQKCVSEKVYRDIFCTEYNLSFHRSKKDQCMLCNKYYQMKESGTVDQELETKYKNHQSRKERSRLEKEQDKERAKSNKNYHVATFDLEAVLTTLCSLVSQAYYKRKLCCYNLSFLGKQ